MEEKKVPNQNIQQYYHYEEDEIDLYELWLVLKRRWKVVLVSILIFLSIGLSYIFLSTPLYKIEANIKNMHIGGKSVVDIYKVVDLIKAKFYREIIYRKNSLKEYGFYLDNVRLAKGNKTDTFKIIVYSISNQKGEEAINKILEYIKSEYKPILKSFILDKKNKIYKLQEEKNIIKNLKIKELEEQKRSLLETEIPLMERKRDFLQEKVKNLNLLIKSYLSSISNYEEVIKNLSIGMKNPNLSDSSLSIVSNQIVQYDNLIISPQNKINNYQLEITNIEQEQIPSINRKIRYIKEVKIKFINKNLEKLRLELKNIDREIKTLELSIKPPLTKDFEILSKSIFDKPAKPKKGLILAVSIVSGLFLGIFLAFFLEWIKNVRKRHREKNLKNEPIF